jgi:hypothetical protein
MELPALDVVARDERLTIQTVALGYSSFCNLFTKKEWKGFQYRWDLFWWYYGSYGSSTAKAQGIGYVQELLSRLTHSELSRLAQAFSAKMKIS